MYHASHETFDVTNASKLCGGPVDVNVRAFRVVQAAISEPEEPNARKDAARKGGLVGGPSRAKSLSAERRTQIAKKANRARWSRKAAELPMTE